MSANVKHYENIYELWYEWLATTDPRKWNKSMKHSLGNCKEEFPKWWEERKHCFLPAIDVETLWVVKTDEEFQFFNRNGYPVIAINEYSPTSAILKELRKVLSRLETAHAVGRPEFQDNGDVYTLHQRPDLPTIQALSKMLSVYKEWASGTRPLWKIGEKLGLNPSSKSEEPNRAMSATVSRYIKWSNTLRDNIVKGVFPKYR